MRGDETRLGSTGGDNSRERGGPRHAAPRKSLLTKLQMPAGKAMALAAMPTAMFVGMSLTPKLAMADDKTDIPFAPGPCVTRSDQPSESPSPSSSKSSTPSPSSSSSPSSTDKDTDKDKAKEPTPTTTPSADKARQPQQKPSGQTSTQAPTTKPSTTPAPTKSTNPLDPLGLGDVLGDILGVHPTKSSAPVTPKPSSTPTSTPTTKAPTPKTTPGKPSTKPATKPVDKTADAIREAAKQAGTKVEDLADSAKGLDPKKDTNIPDGAKQPFPCPTPDPKALANAKLDAGVPLLPDQPWILKTSKLTLSGLNYEGIVEVKTGSGKIKKVLKFTAKSVDIDNLHQLVYGPELNGKPTTAHVKARAGSESTIRNGTVTMYTEELKGNLLGLIPVTFSPQTPPPLNIPYVFFTNVTIHQAGQFGGTLTIPGLQNYITDGSPE
ncbi:hypothetical protein [Streptomyces melanogenes]|uniref:hypothetical protein n=1 Tax=Streptomyces melanogenes TaxID=67326 RepID=UPI00167D31FC|nr:hypothetical protein [Streptomyces melanogenes]GGP60322.1 hypothetical protein GCM10010278_41730 [Streptomyces melanogenes]